MSLPNQQSSNQNQNHTTSGSTPATQPFTNITNRQILPRPILIPNQNPNPPQPPPTRPYSNLTKNHLLAQIQHLQTIIMQQNTALEREREISTGTILREEVIRREVARREMARREEDVRGREERVEAREKKVEEREEVLEWGFEQVEGVLREAAEMGVELATGIMEMGILEGEIEREKMGKEKRRSVE